MKRMRSRRTAPPPAEAVDLDVTSSRHGRRRRWIVAALAVSLVAAVPLVGRGRGGERKVAVRAETAGTGAAALLPELPQLPVGIESVSVSGEVTGDTTLPPPGTLIPSRPPGRPTTTTTGPSPTTTSTVPPTGTPTPGVPTTAVDCPPPTVPAQTLTAPGLYAVPVDGGVPRSILAGTGLDPNDVAASPDGKHLVFTVFDTANDGQNPFPVYSVDVDGTGLRRLDPGTESPQGLVWSPDGRWIAFRDQSPHAAPVAVWVMAPDGSQRRKLVEYPSTGAGALRWSPDSTRIATGSAGPGGGAWVIDVATGRATKLLDDQVWMLDWSPDGRRLVIDITVAPSPSMSNGGPTEPAPIVVVDADGSGRHELVPRGVWAVWSPAGDGIAVRDGYLIDPATLARRSYGPGAALAFSPDGEHLLVTGDGIGVDDRRGCGHKLLTTDNRGSPVWRAWAGNALFLVEVLAG